MRVVPVNLVVAIFLGLFPKAACQGFDFAEAAVPGPRALQTLYQFHVEGDRYDEKPLATVYFKDLRLMVSPDDESASPASQLAMYTSVQIILMTEDDFKANLDPRQFCSSQGRFQPTQGEYVNYTVVDTKGSRTEDLRKPGVYLLLMSNCGGLRGLAVRGFAAVRHSSGFLPVTERASKSLYLMSALFYVGALAVWTAVCFKWWNQLLSIQKGLLLTIVFCASEAIASWVFFQVRDNSGDFPRNIFLIAALSSIYKLVCCFYAIASNPSEFIDEEDAGLGLGTHCLLMLFLVFQFNWKVIESVRHGLGIASYVVMLSALPGAILGGVLLFVAFHKASGFVEALEAKKDDPKVKVYKQLKGLVLLAAAGSSVSMFLNVFDPTTASMSSWGFHPMVSDALPQGIFAVIVAIWMLISFPSTELQGYSYSQTGGGLNSGAIGAPSSNWDDEGENEESALEKGPTGLIAAE